MDRENWRKIRYKRNAIAFIHDKPPLSKTDCEVIGISGRCGKECSVLLDGKCEIKD